MLFCELEKEHNQCTEGSCGIKFCYSPQKVTIVFKHIIALTRTFLSENRKVLLY